MWGDLLRRLIEFLKKLCEPPEYEPEKWTGGHAEEDNNCYNYACDIRTDSYAQPGRACGDELDYKNIICEEVTRAAVCDGLIEWNCDKPCPDCCHKVALAIWPGNDYHWYRQDADGMWSHKFNGHPPTNLDNSEDPISDPRTADRGLYTEFCGCFCVCHLGKVNIA